MNFSFKPRAARQIRDTNKLLYLALFILALAVNFAAIKIPFFTDDQGLYASIAKNLLYKKDFFQLFTYNQDWLDKPHFPFWAIFISFKVFGISEWAYRLPALLFFCLSLLYTFLFTRKYYGWEIAAAAVLILTTALNVIMANTDVRAEPYLMALILGAIFHIDKLLRKLTFADLFLAALLTACAIMTKGIFVVIPIYGGIIGHLIFNNNLRGILKFKWVVLLLLTFIFTLPEFYALYLQFDLHPEKLVFGKHHVSGIKWFLWDSQFGRFINNGPIVRRSSGSIFFYIHTLLWAFAPWCLTFYFAVYKNIRTICQRKKLVEYYSLSGGLLMFLIFSLSRFQLPFYTNAVFPLFAITTAPFFYKPLSKYETMFRQYGQWLFVLLLPIAVVLLNFILKPSHDLFFGIDCLLLGISVIFIPAYAATSQKKAFFFSCAATLFVGFYLNTIFYKVLTPYKGEIAAAKYINQQPLSSFPVYSVMAGNNIFQFYCERQVAVLPVEKVDSFKSGKVSLFYVSQQSMDYLVQSHARFKVLRSFINYPQENILPKFINKSTRQTTLDKVYLIYK